MTGPTVFCPNSKSDIKPTESFRFSLTESTRKLKGARSAKEEAAALWREAAVKERHGALVKTKGRSDYQVAARLSTKNDTVAIRHSPDELTAVSKNKLCLMV
ncbi:hypothetical protein B7486_23875 [cyanobacterium TDX16]|nr:hypothetical protein B7486_23875 [cyanobacterium TDX16]